jgi:hypothetical protein
MKIILPRFLSLIIFCLVANGAFAQSFCVPVAANDQLGTVYNNDSLSFSLASLVGNDAAALDLDTFTQPASGRLRYNSNTQMFTYTPAAGFSGPVSFNYTLKSPNNTRLGAPFIINGEEHYYEQIQVPGGTTWQNARLQAETMTYNGSKGYLATITSASENNFVQQRMIQAGFSTNAWLGGSDAAQEGVWQWVTGPDAPMPMTYNNWAVGEPSNYGGDEDHVQIYYYNFSWNDIKDTVLTPSYIVEYGSAQNCATGLTAMVSLLVQESVPTGGNTCDLALTTTTMQAEPWYPMWGVMNGTGSIDLTVSGGNAPYTYKWNAGVTTQDISKASPGLYTVTVTDATGCSAMTSVYVGTKNNPLILTTAHLNTSVAGGNNGSVNLSVIGGTGPYTYMWSNGATSEDLTGVPAGTYTVQVMDAMGKTATTSVMVSDPNTPLSLYIAHQNVMRSGGYGSIDLTVVGGTGPYTYLWNAGSRNEDLPQVTPGMYMVTVTDALGATATASVNVSGFGMPAMAGARVGSIREINLNPVKEAGLVSYPNPATDRATISFNLAETGNYRLDLFDIRGAKVKTIASGKGQSDEQLSVELNAADQAKGVYLLRLVTDKQVLSKRIVFKQ